MPQSGRPFSRPLLLLLLALFAAIWFSNLEYRKLVKPDEGRYAEIPREMVATGDWLTPRLNGIKYFEKPALQYWTTAAAYEVFGEHQWTSRLWSALTGFLGVLFTAFAAKRLFGRTTGLYSGIVLGSSLLYVMIGHINTLDMGVTFFMGSALMTFLLAQRADVSPVENRNWMLATWAALGFAVLSKGLMGIILPGAVIVLYTLVQRDWALWKRLHLVAGTGLFLLVTVPWFAAVSIANPEFFHFFFIHEHFERFLTKVHGRYQPWWAFFPILVAGILPWLVTLFDTLVSSWGKHARHKGELEPRRFLLIWSIFIFVFFSMSDSKLPSYILPIFPALAVLIGERLSRMSGKTLVWHTMPILGLAVAALWLAPGVIRLADEEVPVALYAGYAKWLTAAAAIWLAGTAVTAYFGWRGARTKAVVALGLSSLIAGQITLTGHDNLSPASSAYHLVAQIKPYLKPGVPFYSVAMYEQTLPFYIKRTVTLVDYQDEMAFGIQQEPDKWIPDMATFERLWRQQPYALAIMTPDTYRRLKAEGLPMKEIAHDTRRTIVTTP